MKKGGPQKQKQEDKKKEPSDKKHQKEVPDKKHQNPPKTSSNVAHVKAQVNEEEHVSTVAKQPYKMELKDNWSKYAADEENMMMDSAAKNLTTLVDFSTYLKESYNYSKYLEPVKREFESKALSEIFILDINKLADSIKTKPFNEYFDEKENQLYFNKEVLSHFSQKASEAQKQFESKYATDKKAVREIQTEFSLAASNENKQKENESSLENDLNKSSAKKSEKDKKEETKSGASKNQNQASIDDWLDELILN